MKPHSELVELLRERGLRVTPQRRAILESFAGAPTEHLSADEVHSRAAALMPELGRGTVYAALAELTEAGVLNARGSPEPVRYETNTTPHQHFRCRLCLRLFDVDLPAPATTSLAAEGFVVEHLAVTAEGVCAECIDYEKGLRRGAKRARSQGSGDLPENMAAGVVTTPLGDISVGATPAGLVRVVWENHADAERLEAVRRARKGSRAAREHVAAGKEAVADYFAGRPARECTLDFGRLADADSLAAVTAVGRAQQASYDSLSTPASALTLGNTLGNNPLVLVVPCHRVTRGSELPDEYVGGAERRLALNELERS